MDCKQQVAIVTGGASGLGAAAAYALHAQGAKVVVLDRNAEAAAHVAAAVQGLALACDVSDAASSAEAFATLSAQWGAQWGAPRILVHAAGVGEAQRVLNKMGQAQPLEHFERVVRINLIGSYNMSRLFAQHCVAGGDAIPAGESRGVIVLTSSVAAYEGQVGQEAYSASKAGVVGMTLPLARDLATSRIRVCTIAPGLFRTPLMDILPQAVQTSLGQSVPFPSRLGMPEEYAQLALQIIQNEYLNGECIRLDGALRLPPR